MSKLFSRAVFALISVGVFCVASVFAGESVESAKGSTKFNALLQFWGLNDTTASSVGAANFRIRRAELKFSGKVDEQGKWFIKVDPAKALKAGTVSTTNDNKILQDLGIAFKSQSELEFQVGQFKTPTTWEGLDSSGELWFPERSLVARTYGDKRQIGAMLSGVVGAVTLQAMVSNSGSTNTDDTNSEKDLNFRVLIAPTEILKFAFFATAGDFSLYDKGRLKEGAQLDYEGFQFRGEVVRATDLGAETTAVVLDTGYRASDLWMPVARYTVFSGGTGSEAAVGLNYYLTQMASRVQLSYSYLDGMQGSNGTPERESGTTGSLMYLTFQTDI